MVEHILAALFGLEIDNCEVWVDQAEMPGCDGSSTPFVQALDAAGIVRQQVPRRQRVVRQRLRLGDDKCWFEATPPATEGIVLRYQLDYGEENPIGRQVLELPLTPETFRKELAPCRTFMLKAETDWLLSQGLCKRADYHDLLVFGDHGLIDNQLRFPDECVRHKLLDMVGDLALAGGPVLGRFSAYRSGHRLNAELVRAILGQSEELHAWRRSA
jgi:UDP-3-O-acyl N-acetylglucosamine deacetylase